MIYTNQTPTSGMGFSHALGEVRELVEEIKNFNLSGIRDEACDVYSCFTCALAECLGIPLPILWTRSVSSWIAREKWIESWLNSQGLPYEPWMLKFGSNHHRSSKLGLIRWLAEFEKRAD